MPEGTGVVPWPRRATSSAPRVGVVSSQPPASWSKGAARAIVSAGRISAAAARSHAWIQEKDICTTPRSVLASTASAFSSWCRVSISSTSSRTKPRLCWRGTPPYPPQATPLSSNPNRSSGLSTELE
eukprot:scaffold35167_cov62-Phaeocystis_antarctica.AAC.2